MKNTKTQAAALFIFMMLMYAASYFQRTAIPGTIFGELQQEGFSALQISNFGASYVYIYAFMQIPVGFLVDRFGGVRAIRAGGILLSLGALLFPCVSNYYLLCFCRMLAGLGSSAMYLSLVKETDRIFGRENYASMLGVVYFLGYGGGLIGTLPFAAVNTLFPWRQVLLGAGILAAGIYIVFLLFSSKAELPELRTSKFSWKPMLEILQNPASWQITYCSSVSFVIYIVIQTVFGKKFLEDVSGMSSIAASSVIFFLTIVCMFVLFFSGRLCKRWGNRRKPFVLSAVIFSFAVTVTMLLLLCFRGPGWAFGCCYLSYAAISGCTVIFASLMQEVNDPEHITLCTGVTNMASYFFVALSSRLIGRLLDLFGTVSPGSRSYPMEAYITLFAVLLLPTAVSIAVAAKIPETCGKFLKK